MLSAKWFSKIVKTSKQSKIKSLKTSFSALSVFFIYREKSLQARATYKVEHTWYFLYISTEVRHHKEKASELE